MKEQKIIRYRLSISMYFPATHPERGIVTCFPGLILEGSKIHTIRANAELWQKRMAKVQAGKAVIELYYWEYKPYRSNQIVFKVIDQSSGCGIQLVDMTFLELLGEITVEDRIIDVIDVALNDGLRLKYFREWFQKYDLSKPLAIIHFTKFRY